MKLIMKEQLITLRNHLAKIPVAGKTPYLVESTIIVKDLLSKVETIFVDIRALLEKEYILKFEKQKVVLEKQYRKEFKKELKKALKEQLIG
ncbi:MAG: hypothetical protein ACTSPK_00165 [Candidatus Heimdallarchaeota archaeon]